MHQRPFVFVPCPLRTLALASVLMFSLSSDARSQTPRSCEWKEGFTVSGLDGTVYDIATLETPEGTQIYVGGSFRAVDGEPANHVALWQDGQWQTLEGSNGIGVDDTVWALEIFDDGGGPALYVGGEFQTAGGLEALHIARWNGISWSAVGPSETPGLTPRLFPNAVPVNDLQTFDDGSGLALYVSGDFSAAGGTAAPGFARWDGSDWSSPIDPQSNIGNNTLAVWDDGSGADLYLGGRRLESGQLISLGPGLEGSAAATASVVWDDGSGSGPTLFVAGRDQAFRPVVQMWSGSNWTTVGKGDSFGQIWDLAVYGSKLYAGGFFDNLDEAEADLVAVYDGVSWSRLDNSPVPTLDGYVVRALHVAEVSKPTLLVGGEFTSAGGIKAPRLAFWNADSAWSAPGSQTPDAGGILGRVESLVEWDDGSGATPFAGGDFRYASGRRVNHIAKWDSGRWVPLTSGGEIGLPGVVHAMAVWDDGTGEALYVGGRFDTAGGKVVKGVAKWDGEKWAPLSGSRGTGVLPSTVYTLQPWKHNSRPALFVGGSFVLAGGIEASHIAAWNGREWAPPNYPYGPWAGEIYSMEVWNDGAGEALYVGGHYSGTATNLFYLDNIAKWDGRSWSNVDPEDSLLHSLVLDLEVSSVEGRKLLYSASSHGVRRWDGSTWQHAGTDDDRISGVARSLQAWNDGSGEALFAGINASSKIGKWDGTTWSELSGPKGAGTDGPIEAMLSRDDNTSLLVGGAFSVAGGIPSAGIGRWDCTGSCSDDPDHFLCLGNTDRFVIDVSWRDFDGNEDEGRVVPFQTDDSGLFYFFDADNWELLVKVLDGCGFNDHFWVFSAATTNVEYTLAVTDTITGRRKSYFNPLGEAAPSITDTSAFATCDAGLASSSGGAVPISLADQGISKFSNTMSALDKTDCVSTDTTMCLEDGRFALEIDWRDFEGNGGSGKVVPDTPSDDSGLFQFFGENNWEVLVKVLDACSFNDRFWIFSAATTNVEYTLRVTDTSTGETVDYFNPLGNAASAVTDTDAFATCR
ncbi:MAG: hypothetical protein MPN21_11210 [Thermoanaerobaculia bacterium]|nr:hypothetical protein [Thermoanaerobaculia bacterium]